MSGISKFGLVQKGIGEPGFVTLLCVNRVETAAGELG